MTLFSTHAPAAVVMVRPHAFRLNPDTLADNAFQASGVAASPDAVSAAAYAEVTATARQLEQAGVTVHLFEDRGHDTPDSVFPNNWFSTHAGGQIAIFPMATPSRRLERRADIIDLLKRRYRVQDVIDYSGLEPDHVYLEGTGAMVLDHVDRVAYVARSNRANPLALERFCTHFNYEPMVFDAVDAAGRAVYHTNVLMCIGTDFAIAGLDMIVGQQRRDEVRQRLSETGRSVMAITAAQVGEFAGNALELQGAKGRLLVMSSRGVRALSADQLAMLKNSVDVLAVDVPTIELAGGSVRCMLAGVHLRPRPDCETDPSEVTAKGVPG
jgi:hypothetical protein